MKEPSKSIKIVIEINPERTGYGIDVAGCTSITHLQDKPMRLVQLTWALAADLVNVLTQLQDIEREKRDFELYGFDAPLR